jgi:hypothetical protein
MGLRPNSVNTCRAAIVGRTVSGCVGVRLHSSSNYRDGACLKACRASDPSQIPLLLDAPGAHESDDYRHSSRNVNIFAFRPNPELTETSPALIMRASAFPNMSNCLIWHPSPQSASGPRGGAPVRARGASRAVLVVTLLLCMVAAVGGACVLGLLAAVGGACAALRGRRGWRRQCAGPG